MSWYDVMVRLVGVGAPSFMTDKEMVEFLADKLKVDGQEPMIGNAVVVFEEEAGEDDFPNEDD